MSFLQSTLSHPVSLQDAVAHTFLTELGLRETGIITESEFLEKMVLWLQDETKGVEGRLMIGS